MSKKLEHSTLEILEAIKTGTFLDHISNVSHYKQRDREQLGEVLASLHNSGEIDVISEFKNLQNKSDSAGDFFSAMHILEKTLPDLNYSVDQVMDCVQHIIAEAGQDLAAGGLIQPFTDFCKAIPSRVDEALEFILSNPGSYGTLLPPVLIAGTGLDIEKYVTQAIHYISHENAIIRSNAVFALGRIQFSSESDYPPRILNGLATICETEVQDQVLSSVVRTVCNILTANDFYTDEALEILSSALSKGDGHTLYTASHVFGYECKKLREDVLDTILTALSSVDSEHRGTLGNIGHGISILLKRDDPEKGINFLERFLLQHQGKVTIESLDHLVHSVIGQDISLLNKLMTKWFLKGDRILCDSIRTIVDISHNKEPRLSIDQTELPPGNSVHHIFIARKAIGYLFMNAVTCTSILLSLMENYQEESVLNDIGMLIFDPILLNYSGGPYHFLKENQGKFSEPVNLEIQKAINAIDDYLEGLRSVPEIPEMFPTQQQREIQRRSIGRKMAESYKEAQKDSIMNLICSKSILLYGRSSIVRVYNSSGESNRMEIPMHQHSVSFEVPRQADISPVDFDYTLRVFRNERLIEL